MMRSALPVRIIHLVNTFPRGLYGIILLSVLLAGTLPSYFFVSAALRGTFPSYFLFLPIFFPLATLAQMDLGSFLFGKPGILEPIESEVRTDSPTDWIEDLGGDGSRVAAYLRVSTGRQAKKGLSLEAQRDQLDSYKTILGPSRIYWFVDAGKSGRDFDKRKLDAIMELKERGKIDELWVASVDRIGRDCRKLILFFLNLCNEGVVIRTPEKKYDVKDLSSLLMLVIEAHESQKGNDSRTKTVIASKVKFFKQKHWNKLVPLGYRKKDGWLEKIHDWGPLIKDAYATMQRAIFKPSFESVKAAINDKYGGFLPKALTRHQIKRIFTDPVYVGKPQHLGEVVPDSNLAYVDEKTFMEVQKIVNRIHQKHSRKHIDPVRDGIAEYGISALDFYDHSVELHHKDCGGVWVKNGTETANGVTRQNFLCQKCGRQTKVPKNAQIRRIQEWAAKQEKLFQGGKA